MIRLDYRPAKLNQDHSGKGHEADGVQSKVLTFSILEIPLDEGELCAFTGDPYAGRLLFNAKKDGLKEPTMPWIGTIYPDIKLKGALVKVRLLGDRVYEFKDCKVDGITFDRVLGGTTQIACKGSCTPNLDSTFPAFIAALGENCDIAIDSELPTDQQDLPLSRHGEGEQPELGEKKTKRGNGRGRGRKGKGERPAATH